MRNMLLLIRREKKIIDSRLRPLKYPADEGLLKHVFKIYFFKRQIFQISGIDFQLPDLALNELAESVSFSFK